MPTIHAGATGYLGPLSSLVTLPTVSALSSDEERPSSVATTLAGRRVAFVGPAARRSWDVSVAGARPDEIGAFIELVRSGAGPWWWISPLAQVTNVMTPDMAACLVPSSGAEVRGGFDTGMGASQASLVGATSVTFAGVPVRAGMPVTASAYVWAPTAGDRIAISWEDGTKANTGVSTTITAGAAAVRAAISVATVPPGTTSAKITLTTMAPVTRPSLTWTADLLPWSVGHGCDAATVTSYSGDVRASYRQPGRPRTQAITFTVQEID